MAAGVPAPLCLLRPAVAARQAPSRAGPCVAAAAGAGPWQPAPGCAVQLGGPHQSQPEPSLARRQRLASPDPRPCRQPAPAPALRLASTAGGGGSPAPGAERRRKLTEGRR